MDECIESLGEAKVSFTLDANSGYWQVYNKDENKDKMRLSLTMACITVLECLLV